VSKTAIEWTDKVWNPTRGCSRVSAGCDNCYAMRQAHRFDTISEKSPYHGLTTIRKGKVDWAGVARFVPEMLGAPLKWRKPQRIFVNSMSDLFHPSLSNEEIAAVFGVMAACPQHTFQVLTKQPRRAAEWFKVGEELTALAGERLAADNGWCHAHEGEHWPLPNVHLGVSAENQEAWNARLNFVHTCPAAVHFASFEPLLGPIKLRGTGAIHLDWAIVGGESGPGARPCDVAWLENIDEQCRENAIPVFVKQLGGNCFAPWNVEWRDSGDGSSLAYFGKIHLATVWRNGTWHTWDANGTGGENAQERTVELAKPEVEKALARQHANPIKGWARHKHMLKDRAGGDPSEWPEALRVRQFPEVAR
jgi:protein gp37